MESNKPNNAFTVFVNIAPFLLLTAAMASAVMSRFDFYGNWYGDIFGFSIVTNLVFLRIYLRKAYCNPTKVAVYGLLLMNIIFIVIGGTQYYSTMYDIGIGIVAFIIIIITKVKKW